MGGVPPPPVASSPAPPAKTAGAAAGPTEIKAKETKAEIVSSGISGGTSGSGHGKAEVRIAIEASQSKLDTLSCRSLLYPRRRIISIFHIPFSPIFMLSLANFCEAWRISLIFFLVTTWPLYKIVRFNYFMIHLDVRLKVKNLTHDMRWKKEHIPSAIFHEPKM